MTESVILNEPAILIGFLIALILSAVAVVRKLHPAVTLTAVAVFVAAMSGALLKGVDLYEAGAVAAVFAAVCMIPLWTREGK